MSDRKPDLIAQTFKQLLLKYNTNAYRIAKETGIDKTYLSKLSAGAIAKPGQDKLAKIAAALDLDLEQLQQVFSNPRLAIQKLELEGIEINSSPKEIASSLKSRQDWGNAPDGTICYHRQTEINRLKQTIGEQRCRISTIYGLDGMGKTTIAVEFAKQMAAEFDYLLWRTLGNVCLTEILVQDALKLFTQDVSELGIESQITQLMQYLRHHRCLIVLDEVETILATGSSLQPYRNGCEAYKELFKQIAQTQHQSSVLLVSNEKPRDLAIWESASAAIYSLQIQGSEEVGYKILQDKQIIYSSAWDELITAYRGHPLALKIVATTIEELFNGDVIDFLRQNTLFLGDLQFLLYQQYQRLSELEQQILTTFAQIDRPLSFKELIARYNNQLRCSQIIECLHSLGRRSLLDLLTSENLSSNQPSNFYSIHPVVRKYIQSQSY